MPEGRFWTAAEKRAILEEYELAAWGTKGAVLRRHRVTYGALARWATYRDHGLLDGVGSRGWQRRMTPRAENAEIARLRAEVRRLEAERDQAVRDREVATAAAEVLGKASALLQQMLQGAEPTKPSDPCSPTASST
jgi:transposase